MPELGRALRWVGKNEAHYGVILVSPRKDRNAVGWASHLVATVADEVER